MGEMKVDLYVSERDNIPSYSFLSAGRSVSVLPPGEQWRFVRSVDSADFNLPEAIEEEIAVYGFWAFGGGGRFAIDTGRVQYSSPLVWHPSGGR
jgi:hypothetical protein